MSRTTTDNTYQHGKNIYQENQHSTNFIQTLMNVLKGNIGIGVLSLPYAVGQAGSLFGPIIILLAGIIVTYNMIILSESNLILLQRFKKNRLGLAGTIKYSLKPYLNEKTVNIITYVFNSFLVVYLIGSSAIYILAASEIFNNVVGDIFKDVRVWVCIFTIPILCLSIISRIGAISIISGFANTFILIGLMGVILACVLRIGIFPSVSYVSSIYTVPSCISTVVFAFEGMSSILPLINSMEDKNKLPLVLIVGNVITITAYLLVGSLGYMAYGSDINPQILLNLPENGLFNVGKIIYSFGLLLSFLITVYCVHTIIMPFIVKRISFSSMEQTCVEFSIRTFIIVIGVCLAVGIPWFEDLLNLLGSFFSIPISFIIPPIVHILTLNASNENNKMTRARLFLNIFIVILGSFFTGVSAFSSIKGFMVNINL